MDKEEMTIIPKYTKFKVWIKGCVGFKEVESEKPLTPKEALKHFKAIAVLAN